VLALGESSGRSDTFDIGGVLVNAESVRKKFESLPLELLKHWARDQARLF
jgi:hypothetical protein